MKYILLVLFAFTVMADTPPPRVPKLPYNTYMTGRNSTNDGDTQLIKSYNFGFEGEGVWIGQNSDSTNKVNIGGDIGTGTRTGIAIEHQSTLNLSNIQITPGGAQGYTEIDSADMYLFGHDAGWGGSSPMNVYFFDGSAGKYVNLRAPASISASYTLKFPTAKGTSGQVLSFDGTDQLSFTSNTATATALASDPSDCASDRYATSIAASGNLTCGQVTNAGLAGSIAASKLVGTDIASVGTITTGTWNATAIGPVYGGTGLTSYSTGDTVYASASNTLSKLSKPSTDTSVLEMTTSGVPSWRVDSDEGNPIAIAGGLTWSGSSVATKTTVNWAQYWRKGHYAYIEFHLGCCNADNTFMSTNNNDLTLTLPNSWSIDTTRISSTDYTQHGDKHVFSTTACRFFRSGNAWYSAQAVRHASDNTKIIFYENTQSIWESWMGTPTGNSHTSGLWCTLKIPVSGW